MKKRKVLVLGYLPPPQEGTAKMTELVVNSLLLKERFEIDFLSIRKISSAQKRGRLGVSNILINLQNLSEFLLMLLFRRPALVYMPLAQNKMGFLRDSLFIIASRLLFLRTCVHFHGGNFDLFYASQGRIFRGYIAFIVSEIHCLIVLADKFRAHFERFIKLTKIHRLYNCLPGGLEPETGEKRPAAVVNVLFLAYLSRAKGALDLVLAIPDIVREYGRNIHFTLCGQPVDIERNISFLPDMNNGYKRMIDFIENEGIANFVSLKTAITSDEKNQLYKNADLFVFPTYSEGCGLVALEAMAFGLPIVTTSVGALGEMLKENENCLFVEPGNIRELSSKIRYLLKNQTLSMEMGKANKEAALSKFNSDIYLKKLADIWYNCLD